MRTSAYAHLTRTPFAWALHTSGQRTGGLGEYAYRSESSRNTRPNRLCTERSSETLIWMGRVGSFVHNKNDGRNRVLNFVLMRVLFGAHCIVMVATLRRLTAPCPSTSPLSVGGWLSMWVVVRWREGQPFRTPFLYSWTGSIHFLPKRVRASNQFVDADIPRSATCWMIYLCI